MNKRDYCSIPFIKFYIDIRCARLSVVEDTLRKIGSNSSISACRRSRDIAIHDVCSRPQMKHGNVLQGRRHSHIVPSRICLIRPPICPWL